MALKCGFGVRKTYKGEANFDKDYKSVSIKQRVKKIGEGENDFIIETYEEVSYQPIAELINSQNDSAGLDAYLRPYLLSGQPVPGVKVTDEINDFSGFPDDSSDAVNVGKRMISIFDHLDPELKGTAKTPEEFLSSLTKEKFEAYLASKQTKEPVKGVSDETK